MSTRPSTAERLRDPADFAGLACRFTCAPLPTLGPAAC